MKRTFHRNETPRRHEHFRPGLLRAYSIAIPFFVDLKDFQGLDDPFRRKLNTNVRTGRSRCQSHEDETETPWIAVDEVEQSENIDEL